MSAHTRRAILTLLRAAAPLAEATAAGTAGVKLPGLSKPAATASCSLLSGVDGVASRCALSTATPQALAASARGAKTSSVWGRLTMGFAAAAGVAAAGTTLSAHAAVGTMAPPKKESAAGSPAAGGAAPVKQQVVFVLGGPGSGKGTQCERLLSEFDDIAHFSAGDLLREHIKSGTPDGNMVAEMIKNGQIVPAEVTVGLLKDAMAKSGKAKVLIDGFPRNDSNREVFQKVVGFDCSLVLFFDCPEDVLERRLLGRNQGRVDDNIETIKKRFKVFLEQSMPVISHYKSVGKVVHIDTNRPVEAIYAEVKAAIAMLDK